MKIKVRHDGQVVKVDLIKVFPFTVKGSQYLGAVHRSQWSPGYATSEWDTGTHLAGGAYDTVEQAISASHKRLAHMITIHGEEVVWRIIETTRFDNEVLNPPYVEEEEL